MYAKHANFSSVPEVSCEDNLLHQEQLLPAQAPYKYLGPGTAVVDEARLFHRTSQMHLVKIPRTQCEFSSVPAVFCEDNLLYQHQLLPAQAPQKHLRPSTADVKEARLLHRTSQMHLVKISRTQCGFFSVPAVFCGDDLLHQDQLLPAQAPQKHLRPGTAVGDEANLLHRTS